MSRRMKLIPPTAILAVCLAAVLYPAPEAPIRITPPPAHPAVPESATAEIPTTKQFAVPVLMYHSIRDLSALERMNELTRDLTVSPADFETQISHLKENGFSFVLASDVERAVKDGTPLPEKAVCLTMDDGYKDNFEQAFPILQRYGIPATVFLVTSTVDTTRHLTWAEVNLMHKEKIGFGSHTVHHYDLPTLSIARMDYELAESRRVIESKLLETISAVAYPSGRYNDTVVKRARIAGYRAGWKKGGGPVQPGAEMFLLPRVRVHGKTTMIDFRRKVYSGVYTISDRKRMASR